MFSNQQFNALIDQFNRIVRLMDEIEDRPYATRRNLLSELEEKAYDLKTQIDWYEQTNLMAHGTYPSNLQMGEF